MENTFAVLLMPICGSFLHKFLNFSRNFSMKSHFSTNWRIFSPEIFFLCRIHFLMYPVVQVLKMLMLSFTFILLYTNIIICRSGGKIKNGDSRLFYDVIEDHTHVAVVGLGPKPGEVPANLAVMEDIDVARQHIRSAAAVGLKLLQSSKVEEIQFDDFGDPEG